MSALRVRKLLPVLVFCLLGAASAAELVAHLDSAAFWPLARYSDLLISHLPNAIIAHDSIFTWHQLPLWNPAILSGMPLAADPLAGLTYPPNWLTVLFPSAIMFNILLIVHLAWAGLGMYRLARAEGIGSPGAYAAGIVFAAGTKFAAHISLGHIGLVYAVSWTPWVLHIWRHMILSPGTQPGRRSAAAGGALAAAFLADPRWALPLGLLLAGYVLYLAWDSRKVTKHAWKILLKDSALALLITLGLSACLLLPLAELTNLSLRAVIKPSEASVFSLTPPDLWGFVLLRSGEPEQFVYIGVVGLLFAMLALLEPRGVLRFWPLAALVSLLLALGSTTPVYRWFQTLVPGAALLRVPARFFFLVILSIAMLAAKGFENHISLEQAAGHPKRLRLAGFIFLSLVLGLNAGLLVLRGLPDTAVLAPLIAGGIGLVLFLAGRRLLPNNAVRVAAWLSLAALELIWVDSALVTWRPLNEFSSQPETASRLEAEQGSTRIFSPTYSVSALQAALYGYQLAQGISPLQLRSYHDVFTDSLGITDAGYSVALPPLTWIDQVPSLSTRIDLQQLEKLNIGWILSSSPLPVDGLVLEGVGDEGYSYHLPQPRPRAWLEVGQAESSPAWEPVELESWSPNRIRLSVAGPGRLVLSEVDYPGWQVSVDGSRRDVETAEDLFRAISLPAGVHEVVFSFHPWSVYLGWGISILFGVTLILTLRRR
jgi:hypothetical protein